MKNFTDWGIRIRRNPGLNYYSIWHNLKTVRLDLGPTMELKPERSEFYDVGLGTKCNLSCPFCYVSAGKGGEFWPEVSKTWKSWLDSFPEDIAVDPKTTNDETVKELLSIPEKGDSADVINLKLIAKMMELAGKPIVYTEKPFQIAIGSTMEPTIHPEFVEFLEMVYNTRVVPNYTTNGLTLSDYNSSECKKLLEATSQFCGGVAVSYGNRSVRKEAEMAVKNLMLYGNCKVMIHHLISDKPSVDEFIQVAKEYGKDLHYHVLLPLMKHGRSKKGLEPGVFEYMAEEINKNNITNLAFGANFIGELQAHPDLIKVYEYPQETYSKNILIKDEKIVITPSSYNLEPCKIVEV